MHSEFSSVLLNLKLHQIKMFIFSLTVKSGTLLDKWSTKLRRYKYIGTCRPKQCAFRFCDILVPTREGPK